MKPTLNGPFREVVGLGSYKIVTMVFVVCVIIWDPNKAINIREWSICVGGWLEGFYCMYNYRYKIRYLYMPMQI